MILYFVRMKNPMLCSLPSKYRLWFKKSYYPAWKSDTYVRKVLLKIWEANFMAVLDICDVVPDLAEWAADEEGQSKQWYRHQWGCILADPSLIHTFSPPIFQKSLLLWFNLADGTQPGIVANILFPSIWAATCLVTKSMMEKQESNKFREIIEFFPINLNKIPHSAFSGKAQTAIFLPH